MTNQTLTVLRGRDHGGAAALKLTKDENWPSLKGASFTLLIQHRDPAVTIPWLVKARENKDALALMPTPEQTQQVRVGAHSYTLKATTKNGERVVLGVGQLEVRETA